MKYGTKNPISSTLSRKVRFPILVAAAASALSLSASYAATYNWDGGAGDDVWNSAVNWSSDTKPTSADIASFTGSFGLGTTAITLGGDQSILSLSISTNTDFSISSDTLTLAGGAINRTATSGTTTINSNVALGANGIWTNNGGNLIANGIISGAYNLEKKGAGTLTLSNANTFGGSLYHMLLTAGTLNINHASALGASGTKFIIAGGTVDNTSGSAITLNNYVISWNRDFAFTGTNDLNLGTGAVTLVNATRTVDVAGGTLTIGGAVGDGTLINGITKLGLGTLALTGNNTFNGAVTVSNGVLKLNTINNDNVNGTLGNSAFAVTLGSVGTNGTLQYTGVTGSSNKNFSLASSGTGTFQIDSSSTALTLSGLIDGSGDLSKTGLGSLLLTNTNTYTGSTTISAGTLEIGGTGSIANSSGINVSSTGTLILSSSAGTIINAPLTLNAVNPNGATIKLGVSIANLTSATLNGAGWSTINTNGYNATFVGSVTGATSGLIKSGAGTLTLGNTANTMGSLKIIGGSLSQSNGSLTTSELAVGTGAGNTGSYTMSGGSIFLPTGTPPPLVGGTASSFRVGDFGGTGTFTQSGGDIIVNGSLNIGNQGGTGTYNISAGTLTINSSLSSLGRTRGTAAASSGTLNISGTALVDFTGTNFIIGDRESTGAQGTGLLSQTGGILRIGSGATLHLGGYGGGTYNLYGGTLEVGGNSLLANYNGSANGQLNLGGGTIKIMGSNLTTAVNANLVANTLSVINTNGLDATWSGNFTAAGLHQYGNPLLGFTGSGLAKVGVGVLTLSGSNNVLDSAYVAGGTLRQSAGNTSSVELAVGTGTGNTGTYILDAGILTINPSTNYNTNAAVAGSMRVGDFRGTGTFTQNGGTVNVTSNSSLNVGNQGGSGTYNINGGTLNLNNGLHVLGRSASAVSHGSLNISAGTLNLLNGGSLINGNNLNGTAGGTGTITQTGGIFHVDNSSNLYISGGSNAGLGTYSLNGGILEIGGTSLNARYNNGTTAYAFNLGGGTIKVIDSDLTTSANATVTASTVSRINTNGKNATFSGAFNGSGSIYKTGAGVLTLSGTNTLGVLLAQEGATSNGNGTTNVGLLGIGYYGVPTVGATANGSYNLSGGTLNVSAPGNTGELSVGGQTGNAGTLTISGGTLNVGNATSFGRFNVGYFGGGGIVNQTGGMVNITGPAHIGSQGGTGIYNLSGGTLTTGVFPAAGDSNGLAVGARRTGSNGIPNGELNISGNAQLFIQDGYFMIGGDTGSTKGGTGIVNQSGTSLVSINQKISLGSGTDAANSFGTYNLNGGILEVGGSNGIQGGPGTALFNFGGGTLKVKNANLTVGTSIAPVLKTATTSTINTNGFDATFNGVVSGSGDLIKDGAGSLVLTGNNMASGSVTANSGKIVAAGSGGNQALGIISAVTINSTGTLLLGAADQINDTATINLNGGTLDTGGFSETLGSLTLLATNSVIDFGAITSVLTFTNFDFADLTSKTLSIYNWSGNIGDGGGTDRLVFTNYTNYSSTLGNNISFYSNSGTTLLANGLNQFAGNEFVPVPEPGTWVGAGLITALIGWSQRKRMAAIYTSTRATHS